MSDPLFALATLLLATAVVLTCAAIVLAVRTILIHQKNTSSAIQDCNPMSEITS